MMVEAAYALVTGAAVFGSRTPAEVREGTSRSASPAHLGRCSDLSQAWFQITHKHLRPSGITAERSTRALWRKHRVGPLEKVLRTRQYREGGALWGPTLKLHNYVHMRRKKRRSFQARTSVPDHTQDAGVGPEAECIAAQLVP